ncbi:MAG: hypothetical protein AAF518_02275 [Spirochaetota bacterium]
MQNEIYKTFHCRAWEEDENIIVRNYEFASIGIGVGTIVLGSIIFASALIPVLLEFIDEAVLFFLSWGGVLLLGLGCLLLVLGLVKTVFGKFRFAKIDRTLSLTFRTVPFQQIESVQLNTMELMEQISHSISVKINGKNVYIVRGHFAEELEQLENLVESIRRLIKLPETDSQQVQSENNELSQQFLRKFIPIILIALGLTWSAWGYFFGSGIVFALGDGEGFLGQLLFWPMGFWIVGLGVLDALGWIQFLEMSLWSRWKVVVFTIVYFTPYLFLNSFLLGFWIK